MKNQDPPTRRIGRRAALRLMIAAPIAASALASPAQAARSPVFSTRPAFQRRYLASAWDRRFLALRRMETGERFRGAYFEHGAPLRHEAERIEWLMRDVQDNATHPIDSRLIELMRRVQQQCEGRELIVTSGYRTRATNDRLVRRGAAKNSLHLTGRAVDFYVIDEPLDRVASLLHRARQGGVGLYEQRGFVHADLGTLRRWRG